MVYPLTKKELYYGTTLKLSSIPSIGNSVTHTGIKPVSAGLEAAAQSLYQWVNLLEQQKFKKQGIPVEIAI